MFTRKPFNKRLISAHYSSKKLVTTIALIFSTLCNSVHAEVIVAKIAEAKVFNSFPNVYSPSMIIQGNTLVMYFGGWTSKGQGNDNIYRSECPYAVGPCNAAAIIMNSRQLGFDHLNDPSVIQLRSGLYIMYMTGVYAGQNGLIPSNNHVFYSVSYDAIHWSRPVLIANDIWMPSATLNSNGDVLLYGNENNSLRLIQYNLSITGNTFIERKVVNAPKAYANIDVSYRADLNKYQILAETLSGGTDLNQIDYLTSTDGIN